VACYMITSRCWTLDQAHNQAEAFLRALNLDDQSNVDANMYEMA